MQVTLTTDMENLRKEIQISTDQIARGEYYTEEEFEERWNKRLGG